MSARKAATKTKPSTPKTATGSAAPSLAAVPDQPVPVMGGSSEDAVRLARTIETELLNGQSALSPEALQTIAAAVCKLYAAQLEAGCIHLPLASRMAATSTDVMTMASGLLKAADLAVFELAMFQSWTAR